jgi:hypothetical protein
MVDFFTLDNDSASSPTLGFDNSLGFVNTYDPNLIPVDFPTIGGGWGTDFSIEPIDDITNDPVIVDASSNWLTPDLPDINNLGFTDDVPSPDLIFPTQIEPISDFITGELTNIVIGTTTPPDPITGQTFVQLQSPVGEIEPSDSELMQTPPLDELTNNPSTTIDPTAENSLNINNPFSPGNSLIADNSEASNPLSDKEFPC